MVAIIDYDAGNIKSVEKAMQLLGQEVKITRDRRDHGSGSCDPAGSRSIRRRDGEVTSVRTGGGDP